jgi:hypothetical protein
MDIRVARADFVFLGVSGGSKSDNPSVKKGF